MFKGSAHLQIGDCKPCFCWVLVLPSEMKKRAGAYTVWVEITSMEQLFLHWQEENSVQVVPSLPVAGINTSSCSSASEFNSPRAKQKFLTSIRDCSVPQKSGRQYDFHPPNSVFVFVMGWPQLSDQFPPSCLVIPAFSKTGAENTKNENKKAHGLR